MFPCSADHGQDWQAHLVDLYSAICDDHTCIHIYCTLNSRLLSGHLGVVVGTLQGFVFPVRYGSVGVQLARLLALCQGTLTSEYVDTNLNATILQVTCEMQQSSRVLFLIRVFKEVVSSEFVGKEGKKRTVTSEKHASRPASLLLCLLQP